MKQVRVSWRIIVLLCSVLAAGCQHEKKYTSHSDEAIRFYSEGVKQWELFYISEAKQSFEKAVAADSEFAMAYGRLALVAVSTQDMADARRQIGRAQRLAGNISRREQLFIRMWNFRIENQFAQTAVVADSIIALYPDEPEAYLIRGMMYEVSKNNEAAIDMYHRSIEADTGFAQGVMSLGYAYSALGDQEKAVSYMQRYIGMAPGAADPHASYGDLLVRAGRYDEALEQYRESLAKKPDYWYAFQEIGKVYITLGRLRDGRSQVEHAIALLPPTSRLKSTMVKVDAELAMLRGNYKDAVEASRRMLTEDTSDFGAAATLAKALGRMNRFPEAHQALDQFWARLVDLRLTETESRIGYLLLRSELLREEGKYDEALESCTKALDVSTPLGRSSVYRETARIHLATKNWDEALDAVEQALAINPNQPGTLFTLTRIYSGMRDKRMTQEIGDRLVTLWKDADPDFQDYNDLLRLLGRKRPA